MTRSYEQDPDLYEDDARPLKAKTSIRYVVPGYLQPTAPASEGEGREDDDTGGGD